MRKSNSISQQNVSEASLRQDLANAIASHNTSKGKAAEAVGHAYAFWRKALDPKSEPKAQEWAKQQIAKRNDEIDAYNAVQHKNGSKDRLVRVDMKMDASRFTAPVKFIFDFRSPKHASNVSRYASVLEWVHAKFRDKVIHTADDIVAEINAAGGFEEVLTIKRGPKGKATPSKRGKLAKAAANDNLAAANKVLTQIRVAAAGTHVSFQSYPAKDGKPGQVVVALGRWKDGKVEVVSTIPLPKDDGQILWLFGDELGPKVPDTTAFVAQVLDLADLVSEGRPSRHKEDGVAAGKAHKEERVLTLRPASAGVELGVSARYADASVVVTAEPSSSTIKLGTPSTPLAMPRATFGKLAEAMAAKAIRSLVHLTVEASSSTKKDLRWATKLDGGTAALYDWEAIAELSLKPLTIDGFAASCTVSVERSDIAKLCEERLVPWETDERAARKAAKAPGKVKKAEKAKKIVTLTFKQNGLQYSMSGDKDLSVPIVGKVASPLALTFRPYDLLALLRKLKDLKASSFQISGDAGGMLCVSWTDSLGSYCIYQPTANHNHDLETKRLVQMQLPAQLPSPLPVAA